MQVVIAQVAAHEQRAVGAEGEACGLVAADDGVEHSAVLGVEHEDRAVLGRAREVAARGVLAAAAHEEHLPVGAQGDGVRVLVGAREQRRLPRREVVHPDRALAHIGDVEHAVRLVRGDVAQVAAAGEEHAVLPALEVDAVELTVAKAGDVQTLAVAGGVDAARDVHGL